MIAQCRAGQYKNERKKTRIAEYKTGQHNRAQGRLGQKNARQDNTSLVKTNPIKCGQFKAVADNRLTGYKTMQDNKRQWNDDDGRAIPCQSHRETTDIKQRHGHKYKTVHCNVSHRCLWRFHREFS